MLTKLKSEIELASRHLEVIRAVVEYQPIGIMKLSDILDLPYHRVRYSLRILEQEGYIRASPAGCGGHSTCSRSSWRPGGAGRWS